MNVANIAQLPEGVIARATQLVQQLESKRKHVQQSLDIVEMEVIPKPLKAVQDLLMSVDVNQMTPIQAMQFLDELIKQAKQVK